MFFEKNNFVVFPLIVSSIGCHYRIWHDQEAFFPISGFSKCYIFLLETFLSFSFFPKLVRICEPKQNYKTFIYFCVNRVKYKIKFSVYILHWK